MPSWTSFGMRCCPNRLFCPALEEPEEDEKRLRSIERTIKLRRDSHRQTLRRYRACSVVPPTEIVSTGSERFSGLPRSPPARMRTASAPLPLPLPCRSRKRSSCWMLQARSQNVRLRLCPHGRATSSDSSHRDTDPHGPSNDHDCDA